MGEYVDASWRSRAEMLAQQSGMTGHKAYRQIEEELRGTGYHVPSWGAFKEYWHTLKTSEPISNW